MSEVLGGNMAFPIHNTGHGAPFDEGMSLRDYFAAKALPRAIEEMWATSEDINQAATLAYAYADAMLKHRDSGEQ
jgi:hypothetical protein